MSEIIRLSGVGLTYPGPSPTLALKSVDLVVRQGDYLTVVGASGSGKSTLLNILGLLDQPTSGRYILNGVDTSTLADKQLTALRAHTIGFVFQAFHLLTHRTARDNVALARLYIGAKRGDRYASADTALHEVGLGHRLHALPSTLSGGEQQRVAIARALAHRPSLLLCDEPTGNLDSVNTDNILALIDDLHSQGMTIVMITHDPSVAARGERAVAIKDGILT